MTAQAQNDSKTETIIPPPQNLRAAQALHTRRQRIAERIQAGRDANRYSPHPPHRIQAWEIHSPRSRFPPDIADSSVNIVVKVDQSINKSH